MMRLNVTSHICTPPRTFRGKAYWGVACVGEKLRKDRGNTVIPGEARRAIS
jgi:hypothetical protein